LTRTLGAGLTAHIATRRTTLARCLLLDLRDGTSLGLTDHDQDLTASFGDSPSILFRADVGAIPSAISNSLGLDTDSLEITGPIGSVVTRPGVLGGRYNRARVRVWDINWSDTTQQAPLLAGRVGEARVEGGRFTFQVRSNADAYNQTIGRVITPYCSHQFGVFDPPHSYCQATPASYDAVVASVTDDMRFTVTWTSSPAPDSAEDIRNGEVTFTSGELENTLPVEVFDTTGSPPDTLELYQPLVEAPQIGDTLTVTEGCDKTRPACKVFGQILNFGGFPDLPGTDKYVKMPVPGQG
jgi:uncharacterized phage protein (TIGR02218 family)